MSELTRGEFEAGVREWETRFVVRCGWCMKFEVRGPLPNAMDFDVGRSPPAKRMREKCRELFPRPCRFTCGAELLELDHAAALGAGLVEAHEFREIA